MGDTHGKVVHLGERDCSVQRRHQKLIEESPSPALTAELRRADGRGGGARSRPTSATSAPARSSSCSTRTASFYFMEMNTRIQVEHPGHRDGDRLRPGEGADPGRGRRAAQLPGRRSTTCAATPSSAASTPRIPYRNFQPSPGPDHRVPSAGRPRRARRHPRLRRLHGAAVLRLAARQGDRARQRPRRGARADGAGARQLHPRGRDHDDPVPRPRDPHPRLRRGQGRHQVPRARDAPAPSPTHEARRRSSPRPAWRRRTSPGRTVFVIDVLRATTTICAALHTAPARWSRSASTEEALARWRRPSSAPTCCWRASATACRFPASTSATVPLEMTAARGAGQDRGPDHHQRHRGAAGAQGARQVYVAGGAPTSRVAARAGARGARGATGDLLIVCAGRDGAVRARRCLLRRAASSRRCSAAAARPRAQRCRARARVDLVRRYGDSWERPLRASRARARRSPARASATTCRLRRGRTPIRCCRMYHDRRITSSGPTRRSRSDASLTADASPSPRRASPRSVLGLFLGLTLHAGRRLDRPGRATALGRRSVACARRRRAGLPAARHRAGARRVRPARLARHEARGAAGHRARPARAVPARDPRSASPPPTSTDGAEHARSLVGWLPGFFAVLHAELRRRRRARSSSASWRCRRSPW